MVLSVRRDPDRGVRTPREAEGVGRTNVATRPKGRGGGGACSGCPSGWLKVVAVVFARLLNTPATLGNLGGWFVSTIQPIKAAMGFLLITVIFMLSFAWMWDRNAKAQKKLKATQLPPDMNEADFSEWKKLTSKRMSQANLAAILLTLMPLVVFLPFGVILIHFFGWPALFIALGSNASGRKADAIAKKLGIKKGVGWLALKKPTLRKHRIDRQEDENSIENSATSFNHRAVLPDHISETSAQSSAPTGR
jgi:hypothetical protein